MLRKYRRRGFYWLSVFLLLFGIGISGVFFYVLRISDYTLADSEHKVSISETGNIGDFVGVLLELFFL